VSYLASIDTGLTMGLVFALGVLAFALAFRAFGFPDLSIEGSFPIGAAVFAGAVRADAPLWLALVLVLLAGGLSGAGTALIHARLGINKFLSGILMVAICYSLSFRIMDAPNLGLIDSPTIFGVAEALDEGVIKWGSLLVLASLVGASALLAYFGLESRAGLRLRVAGTNPEHAHTLGIRVTASLVLGLAATNALTALSGAVLAMYQGFSDVQMGQGLLVFAIAGVMIGERLVPQRLPYLVYVLTAAILGSLVYNLIVAFAIRVDIKPTDLKLLTALIVIAVIAGRKLKDADAFAEG